VRSYANLYQDSISTSSAHELQRYGKRSEGLANSRTVKKATYINQIAAIQQAQYQQQHPEPEQQQTYQHVVAEEEKEYGDQDGNDQLESQERISQQQEEEQLAEADDKADSEAEDEAPLEPKAGSQRELADGEGSAVTEQADLKVSGNWEPELIKMDAFGWTEYENDHEWPTD